MLVDGRPGRLVRRVLGPVRVRATLVVMVVAAGTLGLGAEGLLELQRSFLIRGRQDIAEARARDLAGEAAAARLPSPLIVADDDSAVAQIVTPDGRVLAHSPAAPGDVPIATFQPTDATPEAHTIKQLPSGPTGRFRVVAVSTVTPSGPAVAYVGVGLDTVDHAIRLLSVALAFGLPVLVVIVGAATWWALGRALRPVEEIRNEVDTITEGNLHRRVSTPKTNDEIQRLAVTMNAMLDRLETAADRQRRFTADASHELRSPLSAMRAQLEVALARPDRADWIATGQDVLADQARVEHLVQDLLVLARIDAMGDDRPSGLLDLVAVTIEELDRRPAGDGVAITLDVGDVAWVRGRRDELARVVRNLLDNAVRHATANVTVVVHVDGDDVALTVCDDGLGVAPGDRDRIFERFARLDDARSNDDGGSGLGLAIVREAVAAHDGTVAVVGDGPGACFEVRLPRALTPEHNRFRLASGSNPHTAP